MATFTHDMRTSRLGSGLAFALLAALSFGLSGSLGKGLLELGWSAGSITLARVVIGASVLVVLGIVALRGRWHLLRRNAGIVVAYGLFAVAGAQLFYFMAIGTLDVSLALLIEYMAPVAVVAWLWARHRLRPGALTFVGAGFAALGLALLFNVFGGASVSLVGIAWALGAMVGATVYFIISGNDSTGLPGISLAAGGLVVAAVVLAVAGAVGIMPLAFATGDVTLAGAGVPWWVMLLALGVVTAAVAYVTGIAATRRLGSRLGSFVALSEVLAATAFAWVLLGQSLSLPQLGGAALVLAGVVFVKLGEPKVVAGEPELTPVIASEHAVDDVASAPHDTTSATGVPVI